MYNSFNEKGDLRIKSELFEKERQLDDYRKETDILSNLFEKGVIDANVNPINR